MCIDLHETGSVGEGSDHLQLIKFWPSCAPGNGISGRVRIFGSALLQPVHSVCVSPSAFSFQSMFMKGKGKEPKKKKKRKKLDSSEDKKRKSDSTTKSPRKKRKKRESSDGSEMSKTDVKKTLFERRNIR